MKKIQQEKLSRFALIAALFFVLSIASSVTAATVFAQDSTPTDDDVNAIAKQLYCPVCENTPLDVCPTEACRQWRELIRQQLTEGKSEAEIKQYFVDNYGARVLAEPPRKGLNWLVYILPPVFILIGAFILFQAFRSWSRPKSAVTGSGDGNEVSPPSIEKDEYVARLEEELKKRK